jgi:predicted GIY-YIG superfamily endonuclease
MATNIYILKLEGGNYYVGKSDNPAQRFIQHINGEGSAWTKKHRPLKLLNIYENASGFDEDKHVKELMAKYGIDKVRGGTYVQDKLTSNQEEMLKKEIRGATDCCTRCGKEGHFVANCWAKKEADSPPTAKKFTPKKKQVLVYACDFCEDEYEDMDDCMKHEKRCPRKPKSPAKKSPAKKSGGACYRCGRTSHWSPDCYATTHVDGYELSDDDEDEDDDEDSD